MQRQKSFPTVRQVTRRLRHMMRDLLPEQGCASITLLAFHPEARLDHRWPARPFGWSLDWGSERHAGAARACLTVEHGDNPEELARAFVGLARTHAERAWDSDYLRKAA